MGAGRHRHPDHPTRGPTPKQLRGPPTLLKTGPIRKHHRAPRIRRNLQGPPIPSQDRIRKSLQIQTIQDPIRRMPQTLPIRGPVQKSPWDPPTPEQIQKRLRGPPTLSHRDQETFVAINIRTGKKIIQSNIPSIPGEEAKAGATARLAGRGSADSPRRRGGAARPGDNSRLQVGGGLPPALHGHGPGTKVQH